MTPLFVFIVIFMSTFVQSVSGFGLALVSMAFLPALIGIHAATPLVALYAILIEVVLLIRFHQEFLPLNTIDSNRSWIYPHREVLKELQRN